jgi:D-alanine--poly(phosphoribitol) ligase subunit 1
VSLNLALPFRRQAEANPERPALWVDGSETTYARLADMAGRIAAWLEERPTPEQARVAVLASRSLEAYSAILGACWAGAAYVPLSPKAPEERLIRVLDIVRPEALIVDEAAIALLSPRLLDHCPARILSPRRSDSLALEAERRGHVTVHGVDRLPSPGAIAEPRPVEPDQLAYVMFTSGTTGVPKGVMVSARNVHHLLSVLEERYAFGPEDRCSQAFELTFDLSVFDLFMAWAAGACLCVVPASQLMGPYRFIREQVLSVWFSVPSTVALMRKMKTLTPGAFPSLRYSLFCGEPLPAGSAKAWQEAAPASIVDNLYGPTEATVACLVQRVSDPVPVTRGRGIVAIGEPFPGMEAAIVDADGGFLPSGAEGELALSGPQVARGYYADQDQTKARFPTLDGKIWYLTGDVAYQDADGLFHHLGRIDHQVKVLGNRVELEEVDAHLREICGSDLVSCVAWPVEAGSARGIVAFVSGTTGSAAEIREAMGRRVPGYMVPSRIEFLETLPLGSSGKVDRKALFQSLERGKETSGSRGK